MTDFIELILVWLVAMALAKWIQEKIKEPTQVFIKRVKIGDLTIKFVLRHYWEKPDRTSIWDRKYNFKRKEIGFWYEKNMAVGTTKKGVEAFEKTNLVPSYMFGVSLIYIKFWITVDRKVLHMKLEDEKI